MNDGAAAVREALDALQGLGALRDARPGGFDRFFWSADVLDDLARLADRLGRAVEEVSGEEGPEVRRAAEALGTLIVAHRNSLLRHGLGRMDVATPRTGAAVN
ncbi:hypothetical protein [Actinomycetospora soli]|uniref:hypothetical protein n=1 Tax=Actinomycetospora soli TaxID=2893887 RepID=UPI001E317193|nr:hypothetical protein [Actinomycetospora soli]MCD2190558.1 hypothetical protein [Actinomycetospora soli]